VALAEGVAGAEPGALAEADGEVPSGAGGGAAVASGAVS
jgi:hypothetical protein